MDRYSAQLIFNHNAKRGEMRAFLENELLLLRDC